MKKILLSILLAFIATSISSAAESHVLKFRISDGGSQVSNAVKIKMENNLVDLLTMMSDAQSNKTKLSFIGTSISSEAQNDIRQLWKYQHIAVTRNNGVPRSISENLLYVKAWKTYQIRNIPVTVYPIDSSKEPYDSEITITFKPNGTIDDFNISLDKEQYKSIMDSSRNVSDTQKRLMMVSWMENLKRAYDKKDIDALREIYDKDALIITGVRSHKRVKVSSEAKIQGMPIFDYIVQTRDEYIAKMKGIFARNKTVRVNFIDQEYSYLSEPLIENDGESTPRYYMVWCKQDYATTRYSDFGDLFLLWDFKDPERPVILVRVWSNNGQKFEFNPAKDFKLSFD